MQRTFRILAVLVVLIMIAAPLAGVMIGIHIGWLSGPLESMAWVCAGVVEVPLMLVLAILIARRLRIAAPSRRASVRCCRRCGYDLKETILPRCPECGTLCGFDVTMAEVGLTETDLLDARALRQRVLAERAAHERENAG